jgi:hypothetical protein
VTVANHDTKKPFIKVIVCIIVSLHNDTLDLCG